MEMLCPCKNHLPADPPTPAGPKGASMCHRWWHPAWRRRPRSRRRRRQHLKANGWWILRVSMARLYQVIRWFMAIPELIYDLWFMVMPIFMVILSYTDSLYVGVLSNGVYLKTSNLSTSIETQGDLGIPILRIHLAYIILKYINIDN